MSQEEDRPESSAERARAAAAEWQKALDRLRNRPGIRIRDIPGGYEDKPWNPERGLHRMRGVLAVSLIVLLALTIAAGFLLIWNRKATVEEARDLLEGVVPALVALAGSAVGYYFGSRNL